MAYLQKTRPVLRFIDGRRAEVYRLKAVIDGFVRDLGGADAVSSAKMRLLTSAATLCLEVEEIEARARVGEVPLDLSAHGAAIDRLSRLFARCGLFKVSGKPVGEENAYQAALREIRADAAKEAING